MFCPRAIAFASEKDGEGAMERVFETVEMKPLARLYAVNGQTGRRPAFPWYAARARNRDPQE